MHVHVPKLPCFPEPVLLKRRFIFAAQLRLAELDPEHPVHPGGCAGHPRQLCPSVSISADMKSCEHTCPRQLHPSMYISADVESCKHTRLLMGNPGQSQALHVTHEFFLKPSKSAGE